MEFVSGVEMIHSPRPPFTPRLDTGTPDTCPPDYPWVFYSGRYCCKHIHEKLESWFDRSCDGGLLTIASKCCQDDDYVVCDTRPCTDYSGKVYLLLFNRKKKDKSSFRWSYIRYCPTFLNSLHGKTANHK